MGKFNINGSVHRNNILLYKSQQDAHVTEFILSDNCSTCFGRYYHPSSGAQTSVTTASGNRYTVLLSAAIVEELQLIWVCCGWPYEGLRHWHLPIQSRIRTESHTHTHTHTHIQVHSVRKWEWKNVNTHMAVYVFESSFQFVRFSTDNSVLHTGNFSDTDAIHTVYTYNHVSMLHCWSVGTSCQGSPKAERA